MPPVEAVVVKLGGDAVASPERIAAEAHRLARLAQVSPVVAVTSARRGVTDHLLGLVQGVRAQVSNGVPEPAAGDAEADRAVATGEVVTAALLALALNGLGVESVSLDAREAGVRATGKFGRARIGTISSARLTRLLGRGIVPVVTGFQGWQRGRVATLGRGGTDTSAVALAVAIGAGRALFVKDADGLRTADPKLVLDSRRLGAVPHGFLSALTAAGARIVHPEAARLAELRGLTLEFHPLGEEAPATIVHRGAPAQDIRAVATLVLDDSVAQITAVAGIAEEAARETERLREAILAQGIEIREIRPAANGPKFLVAATQAVAATRALHEAFVHPVANRAGHSRRAS